MGKVKISTWQELEILEEFDLVLFVFLTFHNLQWNLCSSGSAESLSTTLKDVTPPGAESQGQNKWEFHFPLMSCSFQCIAASWSRKSFPFHGRGWSQMGFKVLPTPAGWGCVTAPCCAHGAPSIQERELILSSQLFLAILALISAIPSKVWVSNIYFEKLKRGRC